MTTGMVGDPTYHYQIPVDADPLLTPTSFTTSTLPTGLKCDPLTGIITGTPAVAISLDPTYYPITLPVSNAKGKSSKQANLYIKPMPAASVGIFVGPIGREPTLNNGLGGRFDLTTSTNSSFTGKITLGVLAYSFSGNLVTDVTGTNAPAATVLIKRALPLTNLNLNFKVDVANHVLTACDLSDSSTTPSHVGFAGWRKRWGTVMPLVDSDNLKNYLGYYTFGIDPPVPTVPVTTPPTSPSELIPQGMGYGYFTVAPTTGLLTVTGKLPDGTAFTTSSYCGPHGEVLAFQALYGNLGSVLGTVSIFQGTPMFVPAYGDNTVAGALSWVRPAITSTTNHIYRAGFTADPCNIRGGRYVAPTSPALLFGVTDNGITNNAHLVFSDGGISGTSTDATGTFASPNVDVRIKAAGAVSVPAHNAVVMPDPNPRSTTLGTIAVSTGLFSGSASLLDTNPAVVGTNITRTLSYSGIIFRDSGTMRGYGYFLLPRRPALTTQTVTTTDQLSGQVVLEKLPTP